MTDGGRWPVARCREPDCRARIVWAVTTNGRPMPVDADPVDGGNIVLVSGNDAPEARVLGPLEVEARDPAQRRLHVSHFATCPGADRRRKR